MNEEIELSAERIRGRIGLHKPKIALMLGSGLGGLSEVLSNAVRIPYADLPGFPAPNVEGHAGEMVVGEIEGRTIACMRGRAHAYEGIPPDRLVIPIRTCRSIGCEVLLLTNAAGSLLPSKVAGSLMVIKDHVNWSGINPLTGPNDDSVGPRFFDMSNAYDSELRNSIKQAAAEESVDVYEGVYLWYPGPNFETPAEIRAFQSLGASAVGMSTVPECLAAVHCGMRVAAISVITNLAAGLQDRTLSHGETMEQTFKAGERLLRLVTRFIAGLVLD